MDIGVLLIAVWLLFQGFAEFGWFTVDGRFLGALAVIGAVIWLIEGVRGFPIYRRSA